MASARNPPSKAENMGKTLEINPSIFAVLNKLLAFLQYLTFIIFFWGGLELVFLLVLLLAGTQPWTPDLVVCVSRA